MDHGCRDNFKRVKFYKRLKIIRLLIVKLLWTIISLLFVKDSIRRYAIKPEAIFGIIGDDSIRKYNKYPEAIY